MGQLLYFWNSANCYISGTVQIVIFLEQNFTENSKDSQSLFK